MAKENSKEKESRILLPEDLDFSFRVIAALNKQTIEERIIHLIKADQKNTKEASAFNPKDWVDQQGLIEALEAKKISVSRQTLRNHRVNGTLPKEFFVESKRDPSLPNPAKNQRTYYRKAECIKFYKENLSS